MGYLDIIDAFLEHDEIIINNQSEELEFKKNEYYTQLGKILFNHKIDSKFCILLSDAFEQELLSKRLKNYNTIKFAALSLNYHMEILVGIHQTDKIFQLLILANLRIILTLYVKEIDEGSNSKYLRKIHDLLFEKYSESNSAHLYCIKLLKQIRGYNFPSLVGFKNKCGINWLKCIELEQNLNALNVYPFMPHSQRLYINVSNTLKKMININKYDLLDEFINPDNIIIVGLVFLNDVYCSHLWPDSLDIHSCKEWFINKKKLLESSFGVEMTKLIEMFIKNFPHNPSLKLVPNLELEKIQEFLLRNYVFIITLGCRLRQSSFTSIFFDQRGSVHDNFDRVFNQNFIIGNYPSYRHKYLRYMLIEYNNIKATTTNKCSNTCEYIYFLNNCGRPMQQSVCPWCKSALGGLEHV